MKLGKNLSVGTLFLVFFLITIQLALWFAEGGWVDNVSKRSNFIELEKIVQEDEDLLIKLKAEVRDLEQGHRSIEERARFEHGMLEKGEIFIQLHP